jgi:CheY-like chemotaxis protein
MSKVIFQMKKMPKRILIADDSVTIQKAFAMTFGGEDVSLVAARSADEGLSLARQNRPDLMIVDASMPGRSGYDLCAAVKAEGGLRGTPVYILASSQQPFDETKGRQVGADGHFIKPFESTAIIEKVREALSKGAPVSAPAPAPAPIRPMVPPRASAAMSAVAEDDYGEISVDVAPREAPRPTASSFPIQPARPTGPMAVPMAASAAPVPPPGTGMRPSLIPGIRPGSVAPARPGAPPMSAPVARPMGPGAAPPVQRPAPVPRTLMGLPAANAPIPGSTRPVAPSYPGAMPQARQSPPVLSRPAPAGGVPSGISAMVGSAVDQKMAALAAKGPEYEAIAKLSREIIEQVVWEVVPELAEAIIREHVEKRGRI